jgi:hypothetical protein
VKDKNGDLLADSCNILNKLNIEYTWDQWCQADRNTQLSC